MIINTFQDILIHLDVVSQQLIICTIVALSLLYRPCKNEDFLTQKYLNIKCDFEQVPGGGCHLRESYCSLHTCICKPDFPINIADRLCIARYKAIGEACTYSQECQNGSYCANKNGSRICHCKTGYAFSEKEKLCVKGLKGATCKTNEDCFGKNIFCSIWICECKYGFEWFALEEACFRKAKYGESCDNSINCKIHDEFSECDPYSKKCTCGQFLSRKYALDEVTNKCVSCPKQRYQNSTNTCIPEKMTVEYSLLDQSSYERNSHQYIYIALSMTPFIVFALIGFIYRYVNPNVPFPDNLSEQGLEAAQALSFSVHNDPTNYCLQIDINGNPRRTNETQTNVCLLSTPILPDPPPSYEIASQDLPPSYDEIVRNNI